MENVLKQLAERLALPEYGATAYLVGGAVRDELRGIKNKDWDCEVFGISEALLHSILEAFVWDINAHLTKVRYSLSTVGKSFQVFKIRDRYTEEEIDISLPRRDRKVAAGHTGFETTADPTMTIKEAASRRDFTINTISKNILTGEILDPFNGKQDLEDGVIRMTDKNVFAEDPLRVLRAIQFAARFNFYIKPETFLEMAGSNLEELPAERVFGELEKLLLKAERPSFGLAVFPYMVDHGGYDLFPEITALKDVRQDPYWHPEGDVLIHTMMVVDEAAKIIRENTHFSYAEKLTIMLAALCHDFGKSSTTTVEEEIVFLPELGKHVQRVRAKGHSEAGIAPTTAFLDRLNVHSVDGFDVRGTVLSLVENHLFPAQLGGKHKGVNVPRAMRRMAQKVRLDLLAMVSLADILGRGTDEATKNQDRAEIAWFLEESRNAKVEDKPVESILKGRDLLQLGMLAGPQMGVILNEALELQLDGTITNMEDAKLYASRRILELGT